MTDDTELFRRTKRASWSIRVTGDQGDTGDDVYAYHHTCKSTKTSDPSPWSWFRGEGANCFNCDAKVPDYIQALIRLYAGK